MKKILLLFFALVLLAGSLQAGLMPYAISGHVMYNNVALSNVEVKVINKDVPIGQNTVVSLTDNDGFFIVTLGNAVDWGKYDKIEVITCSTQINAFCSQEMQIGVDCPVGGGCSFDYALLTESIIIKDGEVVKVKDVIYVCPNGKEVDDKIDCVEYKYVCWDGSEVDNQLKCPEKPPVEKEYFICSDGSKVEKESDCPVIEPVEPEESKAGWIVAAISSLIAIAAAILAAHYRWGKGFLSLVNYWAKKDPKKALKMLKTALEKEKAGKYKKG